MLADFRRQIVFKATIDRRIVGSVRGHLDEGGTCHIGRLIVHPDVQSQGIGTALMDRIEQHFSDAPRLELFTGDNSERNLYLYGKLGYRIFDRKHLTDEVTIVLMEKRRHAETQ
jgi:ribosomal protein S18 acetylase RimI-like enzyme